jgi:hypothetical protein
MASGSRRGFLKAASVTVAGLAASNWVPAWADDTGATGSVQVWSTFRDRPSRPGRGTNVEACHLRSVQRNRSRPDIDTAGDAWLRRGIHRCGLLHAEPAS